MNSTKKPPPGGFFVLFDLPKKSRCGRIIPTSLVITALYGANLSVQCVFKSFMLTKRKKENALKDVQRHDKDTGSAESQAGLLTRKIDELTKHLKKNKKDVHSRRGLLQMVADRRKHLKYLERKNEKSYKAIVKKLGLRR